MKFSIILPTFNRAHMIDRAVISVLSQTYKNWELIIMDDGSTDSTEDTVKKHIKKDKRIKYYFQDNQERSIARNNGVKKSVGDYICFLDSDDLFHINHLEEFFVLIKKNSHQKGLYFSGLSYGKYSDSLEEYDLSHENNLEFIILNTIGTPRACVHKSILKEHQFNKKIIMGEDKELWSRIVINFPLFFHQKKTFIELDHPDRSVNLTNGKASLKTIQSIIRSNKLLIRKKIKNRVLSNAYFNIAKIKINHKKYASAIYFIILSLSISLKNNQSKHKLLLLTSLVFAPKNDVVKQYLKK